MTMSNAAPRRLRGFAQHRKQLPGGRHGRELLESVRASGFGEYRTRLPPELWKMFCLIVLPRRRPERHSAAGAVLRAVFRRRFPFPELAGDSARPASFAPLALRRRWARSHGLRRGLHSVAAPRLGSATRI